MTDEQASDPHNVHREQVWLSQWAGADRTEANYFDVDSGEECWISGPRRDGLNRRYPSSTRPVEIDEDVREEYWTKIRHRPAARRRATVE